MLLNIIVSGDLRETMQKCVHFDWEKDYCKTGSADVELGAMNAPDRICNILSFMGFFCYFVVFLWLSKSEK